MSSVAKVRVVPLATALLLLGMVQPGTGSSNADSMDPKVNLMGHGLRPNYSEAEWTEVADAVVQGRLNDFELILLVEDERLIANISTLESSTQQYIQELIDYGVRQLNLYATIERWEKAPLEILSHPPSEITLVLSVHPVGVEYAHLVRQWITEEMIEAARDGQLVRAWLMRNKNVPEYWRPVNLQIAEQSKNLLAGSRSWPRAS